MNNISSKCQYVQYLPLLDICWKKEINHHRLFLIYFIYISTIFLIPIFNLFVHTMMKRVTPGNQFSLFKPDSNLSFGCVHRVTAVDNVSSHIDREVPTDGTWSGVQWISCTQHSPSLFHDVFTLPDLQ